jgi:hypothetical protein
MDHQRYAPQPGIPPTQPGFVSAQVPQPPAGTGLMDKFHNLDPKAQTALAVGGGLAAGALLEHELSGFGHHHRRHHHHSGLGLMTGLIGVAGAGAIGAKMAGLWGGNQGGQQPPPPAVYPAPGTQWQAGPPTYGAPPPQASPPIAGPPTYSLPPAEHQPSGSGPGYGNAALGVGAGVAGAYAAHEASGLPYHHSGTVENSAAGPGLASTFMSPVNAGKPPLIIHAATWSVADITQKMRMLVRPDQTINIPCNKLVEEFGDPWPESGKGGHKGFAILYQYGERPMEVLAGQ